MQVEASKHRGVGGERTWQLGGLLIAGAVALPIVSVAWLAIFPNENIWPHLFETVLWGYVDTTLRLMVGVATGSVVIGVGTAWLVSTTEFPGRRIFQWALMLPLAAPTYIVAYVYTDLWSLPGRCKARCGRCLAGKARGIIGFPKSGRSAAPSR